MVREVDVRRSSAEQPDRLDEEFANQMFSGMQEQDEMLRASGQYGPRVDVPETADITDKLVGFIGRDPQALAAALWASVHGLAMLVMLGHLPREVAEPALAALIA